MKKIVEMIAKIQGFLCVLLFIALTVVVVLQVITRYVFHTPLLWSEEVARFLFFCVVLMGASISVKNERHFKIQIFDASKIRNTYCRRVLQFAPSVCVLLFSIFLIIVGWRYFLMSKLRTGTNSHINMQYVFGAIPIAGATMMIYSFYHLVKHIIDTNSHTES